MKLTDLLRDVVATIAPIGFDCISVSKEDRGEGDRVYLESYTVDKAVVMRAYTKEDVPELSGKFGLSNLGMLQGLMGLKTYSSDSTTITFDNSSKQASLEFKSDEAKTSFVLQSERFIPRQPQFKAQAFDVVVDPSPAKLQELKALSSVFKSLSSMVVPYVENGTLYFFVGEHNKSTHSGSLAFAKTDGTLVSGYGYDVERLMQVTTRINNAQTKSLNIAGTGMMNVVLDTGMIVYSFFISGN